MNGPGSATACVLKPAFGPATLRAPAFMRRTRRGPQARGTDLTSIARSIAMSFPTLLRTTLPIAALSLALAACATPIPPTNISPASCNAEAARWAIGRAPDAATVERARAETGSRSVRVLTPGMAATMDFVQDRLNIDVNDRGAITGLRCG